MSPAPEKTIVKVGQVEIGLKMSFYAQIMMDDLGLDAGKLWVILNQRPGNLMAYMKLFAALASWDYVERGLAIPTPQDWMVTFETAPDSIDAWTRAISVMREIVGLTAKKSGPVLADETSEKPAIEPQVQ